jgi:hypothetical protein
MNRVIRGAAALAVVLAAVQGGAVRAQYGLYTYPRGYGGFGWGGWGGGSTVQGDIAHGLGILAAGEGAYNQQTAIAESINTDTVIRWNQYMYLSQMESNRKYHERLARRAAGTNKAREDIAKRLRDNPEPRDIYNGDALNSAYDEINDPRVYTKSLAGAKAKVGGEAIRDIPFQYASAAISTSIHQITQGGPPEVLKRPEFAAERDPIKALGAEIRKQIDEGENPNPELIDKAIAAVHALETKVDKTLPRNTPDRVAADKYLKALHGLLGMMKTPALHLLLAGVEKRPDSTLGELLTFMNAFNLRFGPATTVRQRQVYDMLYPELVKLRNEIAPALASAAPMKTSGTEAHDFFSGMQVEELQKKVPPPPAPATKPN